MTVRDFSRCLFGISAATAMLAGCGGSQPPIGAPGAVPQSHAIVTHADRGTSWMLSDAKGENLLYVADAGVGVIVYSYRPSRIKYVGLLTVPRPAKASVSIRRRISSSRARSNAIFEYAHGGSTPIAILGDPDGAPVNCSIDPTTGNLAVVGYPYEGHSDGVAIYKKARGRPTFYADSGFGDYECGYDDKGNLFIDGYVYSGHLNFAELPKGAAPSRTSR